MQYCPAKASKILQNEWQCPAYTNTVFEKTLKNINGKLISLYITGYINV